MSLRRARATACLVVSLLTALGVFGAAGALAGCQTTRYYERQRLTDRCMRFDADPATTYIRTKAEAAREGALGGFGMSAAGGCGCE